MSINSFKNVAQVGKAKQPKTMLSKKKKLFNTFQDGAMVLYTTEGIKREVQMHLIYFATF